MYGKVMSLPDGAMEQYFTLVTALPAEEVTSILDAVEAGTLPPMDAKKRLALEVTATLYPRDEAQVAQAYFESTIQRSETPEKMAEYALPVSDDGAVSRLDRVLVASGLAASGSEVRRLVAQGAVSVNGARVSEFTAQLQPGDEIRVGRHRFVRVVEARRA
jgi:tyrosyl-tRNA synthetase